MTIAATNCLLPAPGECVSRGSSPRQSFEAWHFRLKLFQTCGSRILLSCFLKQRLHYAQSLGHFGPGAALRHEEVSLGQLRDDILRRTSPHAGPRVRSSAMANIQASLSAVCGSHLPTAREIGQAPSLGPPWMPVHTVSPMAHAFDDDAAGFGRGLGQVHI